MRKWLQVYMTHLSYSPQPNLGFFFRKIGQRDRHCLLLQLQITKVQPRSQVYSETVQKKSDVTGNTEMTRKTRNLWLWKSHSMVGLSQGSLTHLKFIPRKSRKFSFFFYSRTRWSIFLLAIENILINMASKPKCSFQYCHQFKIKHPEMETWLSN